MRTYPWFAASEGGTFVSPSVEQEEEDEDEETEMEDEKSETEDEMDEELNIESILNALKEEDEEVKKSRLALVNKFSETLKEAF